MNIQQDYGGFRGAKKLVSTCLGLVPGQELLIIGDETTLQIIHVIHQAAVEQEICATILFVPVHDQAKYASGQVFPLPMQAAMKDAKAILICVCDEPQTMNFRAKIIRIAKDHRTKIGNCPGMNLEMLSTAVDVNYQALINRCRLLALALVKGGTVEIITEDNQKRKHKLAMSLGCWERVPVISTGLIEEGVWGNIPSGETYLAPIEHSAEGEIIINGSLPGYVFPKGQEVKLTFKGGELVDIVPNHIPGAQILLEKLGIARSMGDENCLKLAELGIGVNPRVRKLTGKPLMDEKKAGTAHIALGNNRDFGGSLTSSVHLDLVTQAPTIKIRGKTILYDGKLIIQTSDCCENYKSIDVPHEWATTVQAVSRTGHRVNPHSPRLLQRELIDGTGRVLFVPVGDERTAKAAAMVYSRIPNRNTISIAQLIASTGWEKSELFRILKVMQDYEIVKLHGHRVNDTGTQATRDQGSLAVLSEGEEGYANTLRAIR